MTACMPSDWPAPPHPYLVEVERNISDSGLQWVHWHRRWPNGTPYNSASRKCDQTNIIP